jgi:hypothetical protein
MFNLPRIKSTLPRGSLNTLCQHPFEADLEVPCGCPTNGKTGTIRHRSIVRNAKGWQMIESFKELN